MVIFYFETSIEYIFRRLIIQFYLSSKKHIIICPELQSVMFEERLKAANINSAMFKILEIDEFLHSGFEIGYENLILVNPSLDKEVIYNQLKEAHSNICVISEGPLKYLEDLSKLFEIHWNVRFYGKNLRVSNTPKKEILEKRRYLAQKQLEANFVGRLGITAREIGTCISLLINSSRTSLFLSSPWWNCRFFIYYTAIEEALKRGVNVTIFYGIGEDDSRKEKTRDTIDKLKKDYAKYPNIQYKEVKSHCVAVISDNNYLASSQNFTAITDAPWLELADLYYNAPISKIDALIFNIEGWAVK